MRFLIDAQLPPALGRLLVEHGHQAEHVTDIGEADLADRELCAFALEHSAVIVTKDEDFAQMVALEDHSPVIVWVRVGNTRLRRAAGMVRSADRAGGVHCGVGAAADRAPLSSRPRRYASHLS